MAFALKLRRLELTNFHQFEHYAVDFDDHVTVLVGDNGSGKSTVLAAASVALGAFVRVFSYGAQRQLSSSDARVGYYEMDGFLDRQEQYPVVVSAEGIVGEDEAPMAWSRSLGSHDGKPSEDSSRSLANAAQSCLKRVQDGDAGLVLPVVVCYGTDRLSSGAASPAGNRRRVFSRQDGYANALNSRVDTDQMLTWFYKMTAQDVQRAQGIKKMASSSLYAAVRDAVEKCFQLVSGSARASVSYNFDLDDLDVEYLDENGEVRREPLGLLSDGYRTTLSMVADIAYRMALLNPALGSDVLETPGVVLVDEIDLHLHPLWQARILGDLAAIFPRVQFIVTTHAPIVVSSVRATSVRLLDGGDCARIPKGEVYGGDIGRVLTSVMGAPKRREDVQRLLDAFYQVLDEGDFTAAQEYLSQLSDLIGDDDADYAGAQVALELERAEAAYVADR